MIRRVVNLTSLADYDSLRAGSADTRRRMNILSVVPRWFRGQKPLSVLEDRAVVSVWELYAGLDA